MYFIYFIKVANNIKIGSCYGTLSRINARLKEAKRWCPDASLLALFLTNTRQLELVFHTYFDKDKIQGEVFKASHNIERFIIGYAHWIKTAKMFYANEFNMWLVGSKFLVRSYLSSINNPTSSFKDINFKSSVSYDVFINNYLIGYLRNDIYYSLEKAKRLFTVLKHSKTVELINKQIKESEKIEQEDEDFTGIGDDGFYSVDGEFCINDPLGIEAY